MVVMVVISSSVRGKTKNDIKTGASSEGREEEGGWVPHPEEEFVGLKSGCER